MAKGKKIKLVTFAPHPNFGTCLQSYALNKVLKDMGHDVEFIYNGREEKPLGISGWIRSFIKFVLPSEMAYKIKKKRSEIIESNKLSLESEPVPYVISLPNNYIHYFISKLPFYSVFYKLYKCTSLQWKKVYKFAFEDGNYKMRRIYTIKQYEEVVRDTDLFITGSDQIWNPYCGGFNPMMFLEFAGDKKRVAYSSSISRPSIPMAVKDRMRDDLSKFDYIGVREQKSVELLNELLNRKDVKLVVDPTLLLSAEDWMEFGNRAKIEFELPEKYIFCYFVGDKRVDFYNQMVEDVKQYTGISDVITLECYNRPLNYGGGRLYNDAGPYEWVYLLSHASYVCMDSFHATVFALKFQKDFVHAIKNVEGETGSQNTRMYDILNRYGLSYKIYNSQADAWKKNIDYINIEGIMNSEIIESMLFLKQELSS